MNLRKITLRYMGWCPGMKSAAMFFPDREFSGRTLFITTAPIALIIVVAIAQNIFEPKEEKPLMVTIYDVYDPSDRATYLDDMFDETFNYSKLKDKHIEFNTPFKAEFIYSSKIKYETFDFDSLEDVWLFLEELETPKIVIGFAKWLSNGTFEEALERFHGYGSSKEGESIHSLRYVNVYFGMWRDNSCFFEVIREPSVTEISSYVNGFDGIYVEKRYVSGEVHGLAVWILYVRLNNTPPFSAVFLRLPFYS